MAFVVYFIQDSVQLFFVQQSMRPSPQKHSSVAAPASKKLRKRLLDEKLGYASECRMSHQ